VDGRTPCVQDANSLFGLTGSAGIDFDCRAVAIQPDVRQRFLHALRLTALCDNNKSMEFILALVLCLVVVVGIISIDHRLKRIVKILEERERRETDARRIRGLEPL